MPALVTLIYLGGFLLIAILLLVSLFLNRRKRSAPTAAVPADLPIEVRRRLGSTSTNRGPARLALDLRFARAWRSLAFTFTGHITLRKATKSFRSLVTKICAIGDCQNPLCAVGCWTAAANLKTRWRFIERDSSGNIAREYPMDQAMAHIFGSDRGDPGLERALFGIQSGALPEALEVVNGKSVEFKGNTDVRLTIDRDLQQAAVDQLKGKHGAVVVLNPQTGEVLALYSEPSYSLKEVEDEAPGSSWKPTSAIARWLAGPPGLITFPDRLLRQSR